MGAGKNGRNHDDTLDGGGGKSILRGGRGNDTYHVDSLGISIDEKKDAGIDAVVSTVDYVLDANVENLTLGGEDDLSGTGNDLDNAVTGNAGANWLSGLDGNDSLQGGDGDDWLIGGIGDDELDGGAGVDTAQFSGDYSAYTIDILGDILVVMNADGESDTVAGVEYLAFDDQTIAVEDLFVATEPVDDEAPLPEATLISDDFAVGMEDNAFVIDVLGNDAGEGLVVVEVTPGSRGSVSINADQTLTYVPDPNAFGNDDFSYTVRDATGQMFSASVLVEVESVNDTPHGHADSYVAQAGAEFHSAVSVLANDHDDDGDALRVVSYDATSAAGGDVQMSADGMFVYRAADGFTGSDTFTYTATDGVGGEYTESVTVISEAPDATVPEEPTPDPATEFYVDPSVYEGLLAGDTDRLNYGSEVGTGKVVSFAFAETAPDYYAADSTASQTFQAFTEEQRVAAREILAEIEDFSGLSFAEVASPADADMVFGAADLGFHGVGYYPDGDDAGDPSADVWLATFLADQSYEPGTAARFTLMHEIGHALGLQHAELSPEETNQQYTVMTAHNHPTMVGDPVSFMKNDIAAIQHLYGVDTTSTAGDDVYSFEEMDNMTLTIWDAGGNDTLDLSTAAYGVELDLREGAFSSVTNYGSDNVGTAHGTVIENAVGSNFDDVLIGNSEDNVLTGGKGADVFGFDTGWGQDQVADFTKGEDLIDFSRTGLTLADIEILFADGIITISDGENSLKLDNQGEELEEGDFLF